MLRRVHMLGVPRVQHALRVQRTLQVGHYEVRCHLVRLRLGSDVTTRAVRAHEAWCTGFRTVQIVGVPRVQHALRVQRTLLEGEYEAPGTW